MFVCVCACLCVYNYVDNVTYIISNYTKNLVITYSSSRFHKKYIWYMVKFYLTKSKVHGEIMSISIIVW